MTSLTARMAENGVVHFVVYGKPETAGSKRSMVSKSTGKVITLAAGKNQKNWQQQVRAAAHEAMQGRQLIRGAVHLECSFAFVRPKCDFGTGRNAEILKPSAPKHHAKKPDVSKLVRAIEDSLKGVVWADDSQVCEVVANKFYGEPARAWVQVREIE